MRASSFVPVAVSVAVTVSEAVSVPPSEVDTDESLLGDIMAM